MDLAPVVSAVVVIGFEYPWRGSQTAIRDDLDGELLQLYE
jgi:hypothetical protein